jgi:hypothetical protein
MSSPYPAILPDREILPCPIRGGIVIISRASVPLFVINVRLERADKRMQRVLVDGRADVVTLLHACKERDAGVVRTMEQHSVCTNSKPCSRTVIFFALIQRVGDGTRVTFLPDIAPSILSKAPLFVLHSDGSTGSPRGVWSVGKHNRRKIFQGAM